VLRRRRQRWAEEPSRRQTALCHRFSAGGRRPSPRAPPPCRRTRRLRTASPPLETRRATPIWCHRRGKAATTSAASPLQSMSTRR